MHIEGLLTIAVVLTGEALAIGFAARFLAFSIPIWVVILARVLAEALKILRAENWDVCKHLARTLATIFGAFAVNLTSANIIKSMLLVSASAKTLARGTNSLAIDAVSVPP